MLASADIQALEPADYESLLGDETLMLDACQPLNTLATKKLDKEEVSFGDKKSFLAALDSCAQLSDDFAHLLQLTLEKINAPGATDNAAESPGGD